MHYAKQGNNTILCITFITANQHPQQTAMRQMTGHQEHETALYMHTHKTGTEDLARLDSNTFTK